MRVYICLNGHVFIPRESYEAPIYCEKCGVRVIDKCSCCGEVIKYWADYEVPEGTIPEYERAAYCKKCGASYPWTQAAIESAAELIYEEDQLDKVQQEKLLSSLPDIITETPKTQIAVVRFKKAMLAAGKFTVEGLRQFAIDFGCELAKSQLGL